MCAGCICCSGSAMKPSVPSTGHPRAPSHFHPNFRVVNSVVLPSRDLALAKRLLLGVDGIEAVVMLSPIAGKFSLAAAPPAGGAVAPPAGAAATAERAAACHQEGSGAITCFTFAERVPVLGGCMHITVRLDARQTLDADDPSGCSLVYESVASAGVYVRKSRRLVKLSGGEIEVQEVIEGRCSPWLVGTVQRGAETAHKTHMQLYGTLFYADDPAGHAQAAGARATTQRAPRTDT
jgi:hypothetical protein